MCVCVCVGGGGRGEGEGEAPPLSHDQQSVYSLNKNIPNFKKFLCVGSIPVADILYAATIFCDNRKV